MKKTKKDLELELVKCKNLLKKALSAQDTIDVCSEGDKWFNDVAELLGDEAYVEYDFIEFCINNVKMPYNISINAGFKVTLEQNGQTITPNNILIQDFNKK